MSSPFNNFEQETIDFTKNIFSGKIKTNVMICPHCKNLFLLEHNESPEFKPSYCPYCRADATNMGNIIKNEEEDISNTLDTLLADVPDMAYNSLSEKYYRVMMEPQQQKFNVISCKVCQNRICVLEEDRTKLKHCAFCGTNREELVCTIDNTPPLQNDISESGTMLSYIGCLFHVKTNNFEDNLLLTDVDISTSRYRFMKVENQHVALWISDADILELYEFISLPEDPESDDEPEA